jgi:outer membrane lipoprotein carrier protein
MLIYLKVNSACSLHVRLVLWVLKEVYMQKKYQTLLNLVFFASLLITSTGSFAANTATDELAALMNNIHTMQATFEQSLVNQDNSRIGTKTTGKITLERPGKFRWEIMQPNNQLIIINSNKMILYDPDLSQLTKRKVNLNQPGNPAILLSSPVESLKQSFQITKLTQPKQGLWFKLIPKKQKNREKTYQWIKIGFIDGKLSTMYIFDNLEQTSVISFGNTAFNAEIPAGKFTFTPPPNTEVFNE